MLHVIFFDFWSFSCIEKSDVDLRPTTRFYVSVVFFINVFSDRRCFEDLCFAHFFDVSCHEALGPRSPSSRLTTADSTKRCVWRPVSGDMLAFSTVLVLRGWVIQAFAGCVASFSDLESRFLSRCTRKNQD